MGQVRFLGRRGAGSIRIGDISKVVDGKTQTIGNKIYEYDNDASVGAGHILVDIKGSEALQIAELVAKVNANKATPTGATAAVDPVDNKTMRLTADKPGADGNLALANSVGDASYTMSGAAMTQGAYGGKQYVEHGTYVVTDLDVLATNVMIPLEVTNPVDHKVEYRKSTGEEHLSITDKATIATVGSQKFLKIVQAGATHLAAGDEVRYEIWAG